METIEEPTIDSAEVINQREKQLLAQDEDIKLRKKQEDAKNKARDLRKRQREAAEKFRKEAAAKRKQEDVDRSRVRNAKQQARDTNRSVFEQFGMGPENSFPKPPPQTRCAPGFEPPPSQQANHFIDWLKNLSPMQWKTVIHIASQAGITPEVFGYEKKNPEFIWINERNWERHKHGERKEEKRKDDEYETINIKVPVEKCYYGGTEVYEDSNGKTISVEIPASTCNGDKVYEGSTEYRVLYKEEAWFSDSGNDILVTAELDWHRAQCGGPFIIPVFHRPLELSTDCPIQHGDVLTWKGLGLKDKFQGTGNLVVTFVVSVPSSIDRVKRNKVAKLLGLATDNGKLPIGVKRKPLFRMQ